MEKVNLRIQFLTFKIDALVQQINQHYTQLVKDKVENANTNSEQVQQHLFTLTLFILLFSLFTIFLIIIWAKYIYSLIGKRLYSITNALKCLSQGNKNVTVPQQHSHDEIGDLARTFDVFYQNVIELERTDSLLKEKNELVEQTFLAMRDGLVIFDKELNLISHNAQFKILLQPFFTEYKQHSLYSLASYFDSRQTKVMGSNQSINLTLLTEVRQAQDFLEIQYENIS
ncbi:protein CvgSY [Rodentibacter pneumotropicus]|uniref:histidine kinase n=1 Tax=Rodentibacter pneumotropicus TaxID=758 RepID=A0A3S4U0G9_9PAST|nr:protein CvgSY [Rodentibacter pneumotropicus]